LQGKLLQLLTGTSPFIYWVGCFVWDFFIMILFSLLALVVFISFQEDTAYTENEKLGKNVQMYHSDFDHE
jgi:hypothetical protein